MISEIQNDVKMPSSKCSTHGTVGKLIKKWLFSGSGFICGTASLVTFIVYLYQEKITTDFGVLAAVNINVTVLRDVTPVLFRRNVPVFGRKMPRLIDMKNNSIRSVHC